MRILLFFIILIILTLGAGGLFLATWDIPAPTQPIEKEIPNDRLGS